MTKFPAVFHRFLLEYSDWSEYSEYSEYSDCSEYSEYSDYSEYPSTRSGPIILVELSALPLIPTLLMTYSYGLYHT